MNLRLLLALAVFVADVWALNSLFATPATRGHRLRWILLIVGVPVYGVVKWFRTRRILDRAPISQ
jgi:hypothetical protein